MKKALPWFLFPLAAGLILAYTVTGPARQGIEGHIYRISGNQMPSPDVKPTPPQGVKTILYVFDLTNLTQVNRQGASTFYTSVGTRLVKKAETDSSGYFKISLPPGNYSLFVKIGSLYYANWFDGSDHIAPVHVKPGEFAQVTFKMDYDASY